MWEIQVKRIKRLLFSFIAKSLPITPHVNLFVGSMDNLILKFIFISQLYTNDWWIGLKQIIDTEKCRIIEIRIKDLDTSP